MEETGNNSPNGAQTPRFHCLECQQTFSRVEHLNRHSRSHTKERFLKCTYCRKGFYRIDALRRHEQTHREPRRSSLGKGARACVACATGRRKCSGGVTCSNCAKRVLECIYPGVGRSSGDVSKSPFERQDDSSRPIGEDLQDVDSSMAYSMSGSPSGQNQTQLQNDSSIAEGRQFSISSVPVSHSPGVLRSSGVDFEQEVQLQPTRRLEEVQPGHNFSEPWYAGNMSSLNWLPYDWAPDFQVGVGNNFTSPDEIQSPDSGHQFGPLGFEAVAASPFVHYETPSGPRVQNSQIIAGSDVGDGHGVSSPGSHSTQSAGHYYVDGDGSRLPRVRKAPYQISKESALADKDDTRDSRDSFSFPDSDELHFTTSTDLIPLDIYQNLSDIFQRTCITSTHYSRFSTTAFPSLRVFTTFVQLYIDNLLSILPFIHPATFNLSTSHCLFTLSLAAVGSSYVDVADSRIYSLPMHEFLRRAIHTVVENGGEQKPDILTLTQTKLLNCVGMMYSGDQHTIAMARGYHVDLMSFCELHWNSTTLETNEVVQDSTNAVGKQWRAWVDAESCRRTGYCIWLLDCMWVFQFQIRPLLSLDDAKAPIPSQEVLWEAESALNWHQLYSCSIPSLSLHSTIQLAYVEKRIQSSTGEFSRILCIHALFRRTWQVENYFTQPLSLWDPIAERQDIQTIEKAMPVWLPGVPEYSKWRNSACDCLDILHWHANSVIGAASGMEHSTVLHLHLARVILLTPFRKIVRLSELMTTQDTNCEAEKVSLTRDIQRWATEDQYKARLAMIHAGVLFWHVRRYSVDAFYESSSVFLATLALWAYGRAVHASGHSNVNRPPQDRDDEDAESLYPTSMQLDRPADDELVQLFVKRGVSMKANIMGVGNLCSRRGHVRVLVEGKKLLVGLKKWGDARRAAKSLEALIEIVTGIVDTYRPNSSNALETQVSSANYFNVSLFEAYLSSSKSRAEAGLGEMPANVYA
ncbi:Biofilm and cell wall regulator [Lachnellula suecica]|uniref:Biofilm and cell wall regulator n=1 Tax=Lachnellula suecica TaxID=602035 RepID=A0A8T9C535_9HELO|nr:Biofilm and cell wall regulator [Lachnellula suecica]